jgi:peptidylprolyl isomerase
VLRFVLALLLGSIALFSTGGCGSSDADQPTRPSTAAAGVQASADAPAEAFGGEWAGLKKVAGKYADRLVIPSGPSPDEVVIRDLRRGTGAPIKPGDAFTSHYISFLYETGKPFEPYWGSSAGSLIWGTGERVPGWEPGLKGIRAGGIRELIVPSSLAYDRGALVYVVAVDEIEHR